MPKADLWNRQWPIGRANKSKLGACVGTSELEVIRNLMFNSLLSLEVRGAGRISMRTRGVPMGTWHLTRIRKRWKGAWEIIAVVSMQRKFRKRYASEAPPSSKYPKATTGPLPPPFRDLAAASSPVFH